MKTNLLRRISNYFGIIIVAMLLTQCSEQPYEETTSTANYDVSGQWEFTITPISSNTDLSGVDSSERNVDTSSYPAIFDQIFLYQMANGDVKGYTAHRPVFGKLTGNRLILDVYEHPNGKYNQYIEITNCTKISTVNLELDNSHLMKGTGTYTADPYGAGFINDKYMINARKISDFDNFIKAQKQPGILSIQNDLCNAASGILGFIASCVTDNAFRPMGSCWFQKDGGGYYIFGQYGPGSLLPVWTQNIYYPLEWSFCKTRAYNFNISLKEQVITIAALNAELNAMTKVKNWWLQFGCGGIIEALQEINSFYNKYGGFALTFYYSSNSKNVSLYVLVEKGNQSDVYNEKIIKGFSSFINPSVNSVEVIVGNNISDNFQLRRSDALVCNTPIIIVYLIGTNKVYYN